MRREDRFDLLGNIGCLTVVFLLGAGSALYGNCQNRKREKQYEEKHKKDSIEYAIKDSIKKARQDSLDKDPLYQEKLRMEDSIQKSRIVVLVDKSDSLFHSTTFCSKGGDPNIDYKSTTLYKAEKLGLKQCDDCSHIMGIYSDYLNGYLMDPEQAIEYAEENEYTDEW